MLSKTYIVVIVAALSLVVGYLLNVYANKRSNEKLLEAIREELAKNKLKQQSGRISAIENIELEKQNTQLEAKAELLNSKL